MGFSYTPPKNAVAKSATAGKRSAEADPAAAEERGRGIEPAGGSVCEWSGVFFRGSSTLGKGDN